MIPHRVAERTQRARSRCSELCAVGVAVIAILGSLPLASSAIQTPASATPAAKPPMTTTTIRGPFDVKMTPQGEMTDPTAVGRMLLDKTYHGDLAGTAKGEMIAVRTAQQDSAGYVAIERVTGTLAGRSGTFALQHWGMMNRGARDLRISVIPDSGTGDLVGLSGTMNIDIQPGGKHFYELTYALPPASAK
jgi:hypothetical protein